MVKRMLVRGFLTVTAGFTRLTGLVLLSFLMLGIALADDNTDPPGRVARLSYVQGSVSLEPAGQDDWVGAEINRPLTTNDRLWSDTPGSRAELDIGGAVIRLGSGTGFSFLNLDDNVAQMQVTAGTVIVRVRELQENQTYEIDTPNVALQLDQPGQYRVDVSDSGDSTVFRVSDGQAEAASGGQTMPVYNQQMVTFTGTDDVSASTATLGSPDGFDSWSFQRDREYDQSASRQYVAADVAGTEDLDENGQWENTPDYGPVWTPTTVAVGWAPYSFGHWAWISPWGWTWVDNASWGYAPFHYGRWARWHDRWCWVPGPRHVRAVYAPAMVAWVGGPAGGAGVGWFPLGPREVYVPGYRVSDRYVRTINVTNTTIVDHTYITNVYNNRITNVHYVNSRVPGAVTRVSRDVFTSARNVNAHRVNLSAGELGRISASARPPAITPVRQSVMGGETRGFGRRPPAAVLNRDVVARTAPPAVTASRVRMVGVPPSQGRGGFEAGRGPAFQQRPGAGPAVQQQGRPGAEGGSMQGRPGAGAGPAMQQRPGAGPGPGVQPGRPGGVPPQAPANQPPADNRSWAERAHALGQPSLPPSQQPRNEPPPQMREPQVREGGDTNPSQGRFVPNGSPREFNNSQAPGGGRSFRDDRVPGANQPERPEPARPPMNNFNRPQQMDRGPPVIENRGIEERRPAEAAAPRFANPPPAPVPNNRFANPSPAPVPNNRFANPPPASAPSNRGFAAPPPAPVQPRMAPPPPPPPQQRQQAPAREERGGLQQRPGQRGGDPRRN